MKQERLDHFQSVVSGTPAGSMANTTICMTVEELRDLLRFWHRLADIELMLDLPAREPAVFNRSSLDLVVQAVHLAAVSTLDSTRQPP